MATATGAAVNNATTFNPTTVDTTHNIINLGTAAVQDR